MKEVFEAQIIPDKDYIYRQMKVSSNSKIYHIINSKFEKCLDEVKDKIKVQNIMVMNDNAPEFNLEVIENCEKVIFCFSTVGSDIIDEISKKFSVGDYVDGYVMNEIANYYVMEATNQMYKYIKNKVKNLGYNMTVRYSPGECGLELENQVLIMNQLNKEFEVNGNLTESFMINPEKSILFFYGIDRNIGELEIDFDCSKCLAKNCLYKR